MPETYYIERIKTIILEAGMIALKLMKNSRPSFKEDRSIITEADKAISVFFRGQLADIFETPGHILIDEEDPNVNRCLDESVLKKTSYIWVVDPIDASRNYANRMPNFGISIGVLKNLKPWLGAVYFPSFKELFYCDGEEESD